MERIGLDSNLLIENFCIEWENGQILSPDSYRQDDDDDDDLHHFNSNISSKSSLIDSMMIRFLNMNNINRPSLENITTDCFIRVALFADELYIINDRQYVCTKHKDIFTSILRYSRCSLTFTPSIHHHGGTLVNGNWTGILQTIFEKRADFIPHVFTLTPDRMNILDHEYLLPLEHTVTIVSQRRTVQNYDPLRLFRGGFEQSIWLMILTSFIGLSLLSLLAERFTPEHIKKLKIKREKSESVWIRLLKFSFYVFALFMGQDMAFRKNHTLTRYRYNAFGSKMFSQSLLIWIIGAWILRQLFSNILIVLMLSDREQKIDSFRQLYITNYYQTDYKIFVELNSTTERIITKKFPELVGRMVPIEHEYVTSLQTVRKLIYDNYVLLVDRFRGKMLINHFKKLKLHVSKEGYGNSYGNMAIRKDLDVFNKHKLNRLLSALRFNGILDDSVEKWIEFYMWQLELERNQAINCINRTNEPVNLESLRKKIQSLDNNLQMVNIETDSINFSIMISLVYFYLSGILIACVCFAFELLKFFLIKRKRNLNRDRNRTNLQRTNKERVKNRKEQMAKKNIYFHHYYYQ
ncbi:Tudor domain-containing protein 7 [Sarcoptes scabiei]|nr:Tudor domain-containing protein 7 [Sarcoptes scabiei]